MPDFDSDEGTQGAVFTVNGKPLTCGVRFSLVDGVVLIVGAGVTVWAWAYVPDLAMAVPFLLMHFFLFCNVFRVTRRPELIWSGVFIVNFMINSASSYVVNWPAICAIQLPITAYLLWRETTKPWYHGIACRKWNAEHIDAYLRGERKPN